MSCQRDWIVFWERYGEFSSITKLYNALRDERVGFDKIDAREARGEEDFSSTYVTRGGRGARSTVMKKDIDIARLWRERHGQGIRWWHAF